MGNERTEAKKRERARLLRGKAYDALRVRLEAIQGRLSVAFGGPEFVRLPQVHDDRAKARFTRVVRRPLGGACAITESTVRLSRDDDEIVDKIVRESTAHLRAMLEASDLDRGIRDAIVFTLGKQAAD